MNPELLKDVIMQQKLDFETEIERIVQMPRYKQLTLKLEQLEEVLKKACDQEETDSNS